MKHKKFTPAAFNDAILELLEKALQDNKEALAEHNRIKEALAAIEGKNFTSKYMKLLPGFTEENRAGMTHLIGPAPHNRSHLLNWHTDRVYTKAKFEHADSAYLNGATGRISQCEKLLKDIPTMAAIFYSLKNSFDEVKRLAKIVEDGEFESYYNPVYYELINLCGLNSKIMQSIEYDKI